MDNHVSCYCGLKRIILEEATLVLNGVPCCSRECLEKAEKEAKKPKPVRGWSWNAH